MLILNLMLVTHFRPEGMGAINDWQSVGMIGENIPQLGLGLAGSLGMNGSVGLRLYVWKQL